MLGCQHLYIKSVVQIILVTIRSPFIVSESEIEVIHGLPLVTHDLVEQLQYSAKSVKCRSVNNDIQQTSSLNYCRKVIKRVNENEDDHVRQKSRTQG